MALAQIAVTGAATDTELVAAPGAGKAIQVNRIHFSISAAATVTVTNGADAAGTRFIGLTFPAAAVAPVFDSYGSGPGMYPVQILSPNTALNITNSAGNLKGVVEYIVIPRAV